MLGESIETSAGDPTKAGQSLRVVGTNPFMVGDPAEEGNIFMKFLRNNPETQVFMMNTGNIGGDKGAKITIKDSTEVIKQIAMGGIQWTKDPDWGYEIPTKIEGIPDFAERLDPHKYYSDDEYVKLTNILKAERKAWLTKFNGLDQDIVNSLNLEPIGVPVG